MVGFSLPRFERGRAHHLWAGAEGSWFMTGLLLSSLILNLALALKIHDLRAVKIPPPITGVSLSPFPASDLGGRRELLTFSDAGKPTVLYVLSPDCRWCSRNLANIRTLASKRGSSYRFIGIAVAVPNPKGFSEAFDPGFPIYSISSFDVVKQIPLGTTPQTLVVTPQGLVVKNWVGAFSDSNRKEIEAYFGVELPGLTPE